MDSEVFSHTHIHSCVIHIMIYATFKVNLRYVTLCLSKSFKTASHTRFNYRTISMALKYARALIRLATKILWRLIYAKFQNLRICQAALTHYKSPHGFDERTELVVPAHSTLTC